MLHHLPDPDAGFQALNDALTPGGGMGFMVYAPYGRSGVYPLQEAFGDLFGNMLPKARIKAARAIYDKLPDGHPFKSNPNVNDHKSGDAGFYDLLLHSQDRAYDVDTLLATLDRTGWALSGFILPILYDLARYTDPPKDLSDAQSMALAEKLAGTIRTHTAYVVKKDSGITPATGRNRALIPHLKGVQATALSQAITKGQPIKLSMDGVHGTLDMPKAAAPLIAAIDGRCSLTEIAVATRTDPIGMGALWDKVEAALIPWGMLLYSTVLR